MTAQRAVTALRAGMPVEQAMQRYGLEDSANGVYGKLNETYDGDSFSHYRCPGDAKSRRRKTGASATRRDSCA